MKSNTDTQIDTKSFCELLSSPPNRVGGFVRERRFEKVSTTHLLSILLPPLEEIKDELETRGSEIVSAVIARLKRFKDTQDGYYPWSVKEDYWEIFLLLSVIKKNAQPEHTRTLEKMLTWERMLGIGYMLVDTLKRIGDSSVIPHLQKHRRMLKAFYRANPPGGKSKKETATARWYRLKDIDKAIEACRERK